MSPLELAKKAYARLKAERNGHGEGQIRQCAACEISEISEIRAPRLLVDTPDRLNMVVLAADNSKIVGLDLETTGLDPGRDRIRLLSLSTDTVGDGRFTYLVDAFRVDPAPLWEVLSDKELVIHNAAFDLAFLRAMGFTANTVHDTMLLSQLVYAGKDARHRLGDCAERELHKTIDKTEQLSDWSQNLTMEQIEYAVRDVDLLVELYDILAQKIHAAKLSAAAGTEMRCLPAVVWMSQQGVWFDRDVWQCLATVAAHDAESICQELNTAAPSKPGTLEGFEHWNWDSPQQVKEALAIAGCQVEDTADDTLAAVEHPLATLVRRYRDARKRSTTYGSDWLKHVASDGRIYPSWRQIGAASGRMSCSDPNMQQLPRGEYRKCIIAPAGRVLVKADYSQIELRIAAKVSGDEALLEAYLRGEDLHARTARNVLGIQEVTKQHRQLAKALNFGLLYGMGARGFRAYAKGQYGLKLTEKEAHSYRNAFFKSYPGLAAWHRRVRSRQSTETRTLAGRRRLLDSKTPDTQRLNTPVQGTGADGLKLALALLWERRDQVPGAFPVLAVHDEIVVEADAVQADRAAAWVKAAMIDAMAPMLAPVPVEVGVQVCRTWGGD
jgi:DNA polymerase-1